MISIFRKAYLLVVRITLFITMSFTILILLFSSRYAGSSVLIPNVKDLPERRSLLHHLRSVLKA